VKFFSQISTRYDVVTYNCLVSIRLRTFKLFACLYKKIRPQIVDRGLPSPLRHLCAFKTHRSLIRHWSNHHSVVSVSHTCCCCSCTTIIAQYVTV